MENQTAEAERHFDSLTLDQKIKELWFASRETHQVGQEIRLYQREQNGNVASVVKQLNAHLGEHQREKIEVAFVKRWGGRGTAAVLTMLAVTNGVIVIAIRVWG